MALGLLGLTSACDNSTPIKAMSVNIYWDNPSDPANSWDNRRDAFMAAIRAEDPDIVGFQETEAHQLQDLKAQLKGYVGIDIETRPGVYDSLIMWKHSRFQVVDVDHFWLGERPGMASMWSLEGAEKGSWRTHRSATCVTLFDEANQTKVTACNTHFDAVPSLGRKAAELIRDRVLEKHDRVVLMGDFNALPHLVAEWPTIPGWDVNHANATYETFMSAGMVDTVKALNDTSDVGSVCGWGKGSAPSYGTDTRLDWVLAKGMDVVDAYQLEARRANMSPVSDHWPQVSVVIPAR